jgi:hypothetical protein
MHALSAERMQCFKTATPIDVQLNKEAEEVRGRKEQERFENRHIVETVFDVVRHLAKQNGSFRGHDESSDSKNKGNFLEELEFLSKYHAPLKKWMDTHPENVSYFSHVSQNEMMSILSNLITELICNEIRSAKYFSIQCDEVTSHKKAFMSVILRYVVDFKINERCIRLVRVSSLTGKSLAEVIVDIMKDLKLSLKDLIGKGFDGAANMSGKDEGAQRHLTEAGAEFSIYFHCFAHKLNLVLQHSVETVQSVKAIFETIGDIYRYMEGSPKSHKIYENHLKANDITSGKTALHSFSDTRWTARTDNLKVVINVYPALLSMFKEQAEQNNDSVAIGLLARLTPFRFLAACIVLEKCFSLSTHASEYLQRADMDLTSGVTAIQDLKAAMTSLRSDERFDQLLAEANSLSEKCGIEGLDDSFSESNPTALQSKRRRTLPTRLADGQSLLDMPTIRCNRPDDESELECFRRELYFPFLDKILSELNKRFSEQACEMMNLAATFHPRKLKEENVADVQKIAKFYKLSSDLVTQQFMLFSNSKKCNDWKIAYEKYLSEEKEAKEKGSKTKSPTWTCLPTLLEVFSKDDLHQLYPHLFEIIKIVATLPVTVASCERTHSKVKIINNYLRAAMSPDRLEDLVQISSERDLANNVELSKLVEIFKLAKPRKLLL